MYHIRWSTTTHFCLVRWSRVGHFGLWWSNNGLLSLVARITLRLFKAGWEKCLLVSFSFRRETPKRWMTLKHSIAWCSIFNHMLSLCMDNRHDLFLWRTSVFQIKRVDLLKSIPNDLETFDSMVFEIQPRAHLLCLCMDNLHELNWMKLPRFFNMRIISSTR